MFKPCRPDISIPQPECPIYVEVNKGEKGELEFRFVIGSPDYYGKTKENVLRTVASEIRKGI